MAEVAVPAGGWAYEYLSLEAPRRGRTVYRPGVPVRLSPDQPTALAALVQSGSEHTLAARWLAEDLGVDLNGSSDRLLLGVGRTLGRSHLRAGRNALVPRPWHRYTPRHLALMTIAT